MTGTRLLTTAGRGRYNNVLVLSLSKGEAISPDLMLRQAQHEEGPKASGDSASATPENRPGRRERRTRLEP